ncbi:MAG: ImmA/IrrE family metallo-endopeptidase [Chloroflexi bacterium]|nr:ImmA/IrrE family metallo-endopeptidase [Chloroflexota bacterium]
MTGSVRGDGVALPRGFKAAANRIAVGLRIQENLAAYAPIDAFSLAERVGIAVSPLTAFAESRPEAVAQLLGDAGAFSALLLSDGNGRRTAILNDTHSMSRQNSSLAHEVAHTLLAHPLEVFSVRLDCRNFDGGLEAEANCLAGCILVPNEAAWQIVGSGMELHSAQKQYGVSRQMLEYRLNVSGARRRLARLRAG